MKKTIVLVLVLAVSLGIGFWKYGSRILLPVKTENKQIKLTYWGVRTDESAFRPLIQAYQATHPNLKITYVKQSLLNYRTRLQTQIRAGQGPDIFEIHASWLPMFGNDLAPPPLSVMTMKDFSQSFYPVAKKTLTLNETIYALPLQVDGLALYYNEEILRGAGVDVPKNWEEFRDAARRVTVKDQAGQIQTAGAALGTTTNVDFWPEIIALLFLQQPEASLAAPGNERGGEVLQFYTSFITDPKNKTWDDTLSSSTEMFTDGNLAFYFAPAYQTKLLREKNPHLPFKTAPVPQLLNKNVALGSFWAGAVSVRSLHQKEAWEFLKFLNLSATLQQIYENEITSGGGGQAYPRVEMAGLQISDPILGAYIIQGPYYQSWYLNSSTQDAGLNEEMIRLYEKAVIAVRGGQDAPFALREIEVEIKEVLVKYGVK